MRLHLCMIILIYVKNVIIIITARVIIIVGKILNIFFLAMNAKNFIKKTIKSYFNIEYIKFFYLLQKKIKLNKNIHNINVLKEGAFCKM